MQRNVCVCMSEAARVTMVQCGARQELVALAVLDGHVSLRGARTHTHWAVADRSCFGIRNGHSKLSRSASPDILSCTCIVKSGDVLVDGVGVRARRV